MVFIVTSQLYAAPPLKITKEVIFFLLYLFRLEKVLSWVQSYRIFGNKYSIVSMLGNRNNNKFCSKIGVKLDV